MISAGARFCESSSFMRFMAGMLWRKNICSPAQSAFFPFSRWPGHPPWHRLKNSQARHEGSSPLRLASAKRCLFSPSNSSAKLSSEG